MGVRSLVLLVVAVVLRVRSPKPLPRSLWSALAVLLSFWFLAAIGTMPGREPIASRYQYVGGVLLLMVLAELASGIRLRRPVVLGVLGIACLATIANLVVLRHNDEKMSDWATRARGALAAFEVGGHSADPGFTAGPDNTDITSLNSLQVGPYLSAVDAFGSPTYGPSGLAGASEEARVAADQLLADAEELRLVAVDQPPAAGRPAPAGRRWNRAGATAHGSCLKVRGGVSPPVTCLARSDRDGASGLRRDRRATALRLLVPHPLSAPRRRLLLIRSDRSLRPWQLQVSGPGPTLICGIAPAG